MIGQGSDEVANDTPLMDTGLDWASRSLSNLSRPWKLIFGCIDMYSILINNFCYMKCHKPSRPDVVYVCIVFYVFLWCFTIYLVVSLWKILWKITEFTRNLHQDSLSAVQFRNDLTRDFNVKLWGAKKVHWLILTGCRVLLRTQWFVNEASLTHVQSQVCNLHTSCQTCRQSGKQVINCYDEFAWICFRFDYPTITALTEKIVQSLEDFWEQRLIISTSIIIMIAVEFHGLIFADFIGWKNHPCRTASSMAKLESSTRNSGRQRHQKRWVNGPGTGSPSRAPCCIYNEGRDQTIWNAVVEAEEQVCIGKICNFVLIEPF